MAMISRLVARRRTLLSTLAVLLFAAGLQFFNANPAASQTVLLQSYESTDDPGIDPASNVWDHAIPVKVPLTAQLGTYPTGGGSVPTISAKALHHKGKLYLRVEWADSTNDESTVRVEDFSDAVAVEFPAQSATSVPSLCMGQADAGVNIWHWRADSQAGLKDPLQVYAGAQVDGYPSKDALFYTARAAGNPFAQPDRGPVQTLVSQTFGTLSPSTDQDVAGQGVYKDGKWAVVFQRGYEAKNPQQAKFGNGTRTDMAFAVWNGSEGDRNGRKSVSQFVTLSVADAATPGSSRTNTTAMVWAGVMLVGVSGIGIAIGAVGYRQAKR